MSGKLMAKVNNMDWGALFYYDESSPSCLRWKVERRSGRNHNRQLRAVGDTVGGATKGKSYRVQVMGAGYFVSRIIMEIHLQRKLESDEVVDHIDGDKLNNRLCNLRVVDNTINNRNVRKACDNTSGVVGVNKQYDRVGKEYWVATVYNLDRTRTRKCFSVEKFGDDAFSMACKFREDQINILNELGAGYSDRHGK